MALHYDSADFITNERIVAYSYARVSEPREDAWGRIEGQISEMANLASGWRMEADRYYTDRGVWLYEGNPQRPAQEQIHLQRLFAEIASDSRPNKVIFALKVDRFCRSRARGRALFQQAMDIGVPFKTMEGLFPLNEEGRIAWLDLCGEAEDEVRRVSAGTRAGQQLAQRLGHETGRPTWGLTYDDDGRQVIREWTRPSAERVIGLLLDMKQPNEIVDSMSDDGVWTYGNPSRRTQIQRIRSLRHNPKFAGFSVRGEIDGWTALQRENYTGIVSIEDFFRLQLLRPRRMADPLSFYMLDRLKCGRCGQKMKPADAKFTVAATGEVKFSTMAYICRTKQGSKCRTPTIHDLPRVHAQIDGLIERFGRVIDDDTFYSRWDSTRPYEKRRFIKDNFNRLFVAWDGDIEDPGWKEPQPLQRTN